MFYNSTHNGLIYWYKKFLETAGFGSKNKRLFKSHEKGKVCTGMFKNKNEIYRIKNFFTDESFNPITFEMKQTGKSFKKAIINLYHEFHVILARCTNNDFKNVVGISQ